MSGVAQHGQHGHSVTGGLVQPGVQAVQMALVDHAGLTFQAVPGDVLALPPDPLLLKDDPRIGPRLTGAGQGLGRRY